MKLTAILAIIVLACGCAACAQGTQGGLIPPPAIHMPFGGKIITELNVSDQDVLGIIKQAIPAAKEAVDEIVKQSQEQGGNVHGMLAMASQMDVEGLMQAIDGISNIRVLVVSYGRSITPAQFIDEFSAGVAKIGSFSKILSDVGQSPVAFAIYAQPDNAGYMMIAYDPSERQAYAARVVGFVDVPALIKWGGKMVAMFMPQAGMTFDEEYSDEEYSEDEYSDEDSENEELPDMGEEETQ